MESAAAMKEDGIHWIPSDIEIRTELEEWKADIISRFGEAPDWTLNRLQSVIRNAERSTDWF